MITLRFILSTQLSHCHQAKELLVRSREGGFVTRNCLKCGHPDTVTLEGLPTLHCDCCGHMLESTIDNSDYGNYYYKCGKCNRSWKLGDVLPDWFELFPYAGLAVPGDL